MSIKSIPGSGTISTTAPTPAAAPTDADNGRRAARPAPMDVRDGSHSGPRQVDPVNPHQAAVQVPTTTTSVNDRIAANDLPPALRVQCTAFGADMQGVANACLRGARMGDQNAQNLMLAMDRFTNLFA